MTGLSVRIGGACVAALLACGPPHASAQVAAGQTPPPATPPAGADQPPQGAPAPATGQRTYRGLFGGTSIGPGQPGLSLLFGGYGGYDDDLIAAQSGQTGGPSVGGRFEGANAGLAYLHVGRKLTASANTNSDIRYYEAVDRRSHSHSGDVSLDFLLGSRTHLQVIERAGTSSLFRFAALPGLETGGGQPAADDYNLTDQNRVFSDSSVQYTHELTSRGTLIGNAGYRIADAEGTAYDLRVVRAGAAYARQYTRTTNLRLGYTYSESRYGGPGGRTIVVNGLDIGGGYRRPLSFSRRTTISFTGGLGVLTQENPGVEPLRFLRAIGAFGVEHQMGRTWTLLGNYSRGMQFIELFPDPFFVNTASASLTGLLTRRLELAVHAAFADGELRLNTRGSGYRSYSASSDVSYAFNTLVALTGNYSYYNYDFGDRAALPTGLSRALQRQSVRLGLRVWVPVFGAR